jgi:hypothetical protein
MVTTPPDLLVACALVLATSFQPGAKVRLADVVAAPNGYNGLSIEVAQEIQSPPESPRYLCALGCAQSRSMDDLVLLYFPEGQVPQLDLKRLDAAHRKARHVRISVIGRFQACDTPCWGVPRDFRFRLVASKILKIETSLQPFGREGNRLGLAFPQPRNARGAALAAAAPASVTAGPRAGSAAGWGHRPR